jgi:hypothetical protein
VHVLRGGGGNGCCAGKQCDEESGEKRSHIQFQSSVRQEFKATGIALREIMT